MDFTLSTKQKEWLDRVQSFMTKHVRPAVPIYKKQDEEGPRWKVIPILEELKAKAKAEGLWNMFMPPCPATTSNSAPGSSGGDILPATGRSKSCGLHRTNW